MKKKFQLGLIWQVLIAIALGILFGQFVPGWFVQIFETFNKLFGQLISFCVPLIILALITAAIADTRNGAGRMLVYTLCLAYLSTIVVGFIAYFTGNAVFPNIITQSASLAEMSEAPKVLPYFTVNVPPVMDVLSALALAVILGLGILRTQSETLHRIACESREIIMFAIAKAIVPLLPVYVFGIFLNMTFTGTVITVIGVFIKVIGVVFVLHVLWLVLLYLVAGTLGKVNPFKALATMLPAYLTALASSSSAATIPVTLRQAKKLGVDERVADFTIPLCANIHLSGSSLKVISFALAVMIMQGMHYDFGLFATFIMLLGITIVAAPGVPGGVIMAALSVLSSVLGFGDAENALMISLYIAVDSFGTACNVTGDGALTLIVNRLIHGRPKA